MKLVDAIDMMATAKGRAIIVGEELPKHILAVARIYEMHYCIPYTQLNSIVISIRFDKDINLKIIDEICKKEFLNMENISYNGGKRYLLSDITGWSLLIEDNAIKFWLSNGYSHINREKTLKIILSYLAYSEKA